MSHPTDTTTINDTKLPADAATATSSMVSPPSSENNSVVGDMPLLSGNKEKQPTTMDQVRSPVVIVDESKSNDADTSLVEILRVWSNEETSEDDDDVAVIKLNGSDEKIIPECASVPTSAEGVNSENNNETNPSTASIGNNVIESTLVPLEKVSTDDSIAVATSSTPVEVVTNNNDEIVILPEIPLHGSDDKDLVEAAAIQSDVDSKAVFSGVIPSTEIDTFASKEATPTKADADNCLDATIVSNNLTPPPSKQSVQYIIPAANLDNSNEREILRIIDIEANHDDVKNKPNSPVDTVATTNSNASSDGYDSARELEPTLTLNEKDEPTSSSILTLKEKLLSQMKQRPKLVLVALFLILLIIGFSVSLSMFLQPSSQSEVSSDISIDSTVSPSATRIEKPIKKPIKKPVVKPVTVPVAKPTISMQPLLINAGNQNSLLPLNDTEAWYPDQYHSGGVAMEREDCIYTSESERMSCSYRIFRNDSVPAMYNIPLAQSGMYNVTLYFIEPFFDVPGQRSFDILLQDTVVESQFDIFATTNEKFALCSKSFPVHVNNSILTIQFKNSKNFPLVSGIEVSGLSYGVETTPVEESLANVTGGTILPQATYEPGNLVTNDTIGLRLSVGLAVNVVGKSGQNVKYLNGSSSIEAFHRKPDAAAIFVDTDPTNDGGYIYVSNSEVFIEDNKQNVYKQGGVGALTFDKNGNVIDYRRLLKETTANCGGGKTPWDSWISCEEYGQGEIYQIDPKGIRPNEKIFMGSVNKGNFESFAYDIRNKTVPRFFVTKDDEDGELTRFTPANVTWEYPWKMLRDGGLMEYLILTPQDGNKNVGTFTWTTDLNHGKRNSLEYFGNSEGIDVHNGMLYFVTKKVKILHILNLDAGTYIRQSTEGGLFVGQPDQIVRTTPSSDNSLLYFTEDGGQYAGINARDRYGKYYTILEGTGRYSDETTGLSFSPDMRHMYVAYQDEGTLFDVFRTDGLPFDGSTLNVKYHSVKEATSIDL